MKATAGDGVGLQRTLVGRDAAVVALAAHQHVVVTVEQLVAAGLTRGAIAHRIRRGWLTRIFRGVYRVGPVEVRWTREAAAVLACGPHAVLSHGSAAAVWEIRAKVDGPVDVTVIAGHRAGPPGIRVHHAPLGPDALSLRDGLRLTSPARTLHDLARTVGPEDLDRARHEAQVLGMIARVPGDEPRRTRSELETALLRVVRRAGLPVPLTEVLVEGHLVDAYWPEQRVVVETDGYAAHGTRVRFESDRARDTHLTALGYRVLRFTWRQLTEQPELVAARLAAVLASPHARAV